LLQQKRVLELLLVDKQFSFPSFSLPCSLRLNGDGLLRRHLQLHQRPQFVLHLCLHLRPLFTSAAAV